MNSDAPSGFRYALFDTVLIRCEIACSDPGIVRIQLPEADKYDTVRHLVHNRRRPGRLLPCPKTARLPIFDLLYMVP